MLPYSECKSNQAPSYATAWLLLPRDGRCVEFWRYRFRSTPSLQYPGRPPTTQGRLVYELPDISKMQCSSARQLPAESPAQSLKSSFCRRRQRYPSRDTKGPTTSKDLPTSFPGPFCELPIGFQPSSFVLFYYYYFVILSWAFVFRSLGLPEDSSTSCQCF